MNEDKREVTADKIFALKRKAEDIWYYYKPYIIIGLLLAVIAVLLVMQFVKPSPDVNVAYVGPDNLNELYDAEGKNIYVELKNNLETILGADLNGDKKVNANLKAFEYLSQKQLTERQNGSYIVDLQRYQTIEKQLEGEIVWGDSVIYFINLDAYNEFSKAGDIFMPLDEILGEDFHERYGFIDSEYVIKVSSLPYYGDDALAGISNLKSDMVIAVRLIPDKDLAKDKNKKRFDRNAELLKKILDYVVPVVEDESEPSGAP